MGMKLERTATVCDLLAMQARDIVNQLGNKGDWFYSRAGRGRPERSPQVGQVGHPPRVHRQAGVGWQKGSPGTPGNRPKNRFRSPCLSSPCSPMACPGFGHRGPPARDRGRLALFSDGKGSRVHGLPLFTP